MTSSFVVLRTPWGPLANLQGYGDPSLGATGLVGGVLDP